ncbi:thermonuclease family protein [Lentisphaerota bacterium WC36G]|nr:thermonuclease family protein [Lentisphaerae bacterium WC36]
MKNLLIAVFITVGLFFAGCQNDSKNEPQIIVKNDNAPYEAIVAYVYDGDSFKAKSKGVDIQVRLFGIDAPEKKQPFGKESKDNLFRLIRYKRVIIEPIETDKYGRLIAKVYTKKHGVKTYVNLEQIRAGLAWHYKRYARNEKDLAEAEKTAKNSQLGLWSQANPTNPEKYRIKNL